MTTLTLNLSSVTIEDHVIPLPNFPSLVEKHLNRVSKTEDLESKAQSLIENDFPEASLRSFIKCVCSWGGYPGISGRILNQNDIAHIQTQFRQATELAATEPVKALMSMNQIKQLGQPSFASKHLRFLSPRTCPVLDSVISHELGYALTPSGYKKFASDCLQIARHLQEKDVSNPIKRNNDKWFVADVEMALFAYLNFT